VGLSEVARERAERILAQAQSDIDLNDLGETPRLGMAVVGRLCQMYDMQVSLRQSAYGGVRAVLIAPHDMLTTGPAPGLAHGIGASAVPRLGDDGQLITPRPSRKRRPTGPVPSPALSPVGAPEADADDGPPVTEWTPMGLPRRRSRVKTPLGQRIAEARAAEAAAPGGPQPPSPEAGPEPEPGLWVEAFMNGVSGGDGPGSASGADTREGADAARGRDADAPGEPAGSDGGSGRAAVHGDFGSDDAGAPVDRARRGAARTPARTDSDDVADEGDPK
jgi:hypothetical protein